MTIPAAPSDTDRDVRQRQIEHWRALPAHERASIADQLSVAVTELAIAGIRFDHPDASTDEIRRELTLRRYGRELAHEMSLSPRSR